MTSRCDEKIRTGRFRRKWKKYVGCSYRLNVSVVRITNVHTGKMSTIKPEISALLVTRTYLLNKLCGSHFVSKRCGGCQLACSLSSESNSTAELQRWPELQRWQKCLSIVHQITVSAGIHLASFYIRDCMQFKVSCTIAPLFAKDCRLACEKLSNVRAFNCLSEKWEETKNE